MKSIIVKSLLLLAPIVINLLLLIDKKSNIAIGGGGYDLSGFIYGWLTIIYLVIWMILMLYSIAKQKTTISKNRHKILFVLGLLTFIGSVYLYWNNLS